MEPIHASTTDSARPAIYSPRAVVGFSMAFSALAGGMLTFQSLQATGRTAAAWQALGASIAYVTLSYVIISAVHTTSGALAVGLGYGGGALLNELFLKKQLPNEADYPRRSIAIPLIICLLLAGLLIYFLLTTVQRVLEVNQAA